MITALASRDYEVKQERNFLWHLPFDNGQDYAVFTIFYSYLSISQQIDEINTYMNFKSRKYVHNSAL